jgi:hypothetical protein
MDLSITSSVAYTEFTLPTMRTSSFLGPNLTPSAIRSTGIRDPPANVDFGSPNCVLSGGEFQDRLVAGQRAQVAQIHTGLCFSRLVPRVPPKKMILISLEKALIKG